MSEGELLAGLDNVPWGSLRHAYGPAEDVPEMLWAIANGDTEAAAEAVCGLSGSIWHQGTVYDATPHAIPFLVRMAVAGKETADLTHLLRFIAESTEETHHDMAGSVRSVVASQAGLICSLLDSAEDEVRVAAAWTVARCGPAEVVCPLIRSRWDIEQVSSVRATLLRALFVLDSAQGVTLADDVMTTGTAVERLVAVWVHVSAGLPWSRDLRDAATAWFGVGLNLDDIPWQGADNREPFTELLFALSQRGDLALATELGVACLGWAPIPGVQEKALWAVDKLAQHYRVAFAQLGPALVALLANEALRGSVLGVLRTLDMSCVTDDAAGSVVAHKIYEVANVRGPNWDADTALDCLVAMGDPRAPGLLTADLINRPRALASNAEASDEYSGEYGKGIIEFNQELLDEIRQLLRTCSVAPSDLHILQPPTLPEGTISHRFLMNLLTLLALWGPRAAPAVPEITTVLPEAAFGAKVLVAIGHPPPAAVAGVRALADSSTRDLFTRLSAASALQNLSGETEPLLAAIRDALDQERGRGVGAHSKMTAAQAALAIDDPPEWLVPALETALSASDGNHWLRAALSRALCRFTGDVSILVDLLLLRSPPLHSPVGGYTVLEAAADAGHSAEPLIPELAKVLEVEVFCPHAAKAIMSAGLGGLDVNTLANHLVTAVGAALGPNHRLALDLLREIRLRNQAAVSSDVLARLHDLAERPTRVIRQSRKDETLRKMIRNFLEEIE